MPSFNHTALRYTPLVFQLIHEENDQNIIFFLSEEKRGNIYISLRE